MTALKPWCIWVCHPSGVTFHLNIQIRRLTSPFCVVQKGAFSGSMYFPGETSLGRRRMERWVLLCFRGALPGKFAAPHQCQPTLPLSAGRTVWSSRAVPYVTVILWQPFFHPDNSLFIPDCSVLQTSFEVWGKWRDNYTAGRKLL